ncbi:hypothetical protein NPIL_679611 [Nephila pilipes]|uniref:Uncharacterized protein n=1 Tax=Nephila pilipes TaxID=299642 RepID=A0A8X6UEV4_NEPPI|nr:hypothetical protein NPIL_679611 [Nephila pilipes]
MQAAFPMCLIRMRNILVSTYFIDAIMDADMNHVTFLIKKIYLKPALLCIKNEVARSIFKTTKIMRTAALEEDAFNETKHYFTHHKFEKEINEVL